MSFWRRPERKTRTGKRETTVSFSFLPQSDHKTEEFLKKKEKKKRKRNRKVKEPRVGESKKPKLAPKGTMPKEA